MLKYLYKSRVLWCHLGKEVKFREVHTFCVSCSVLGGYLLTFRERMEVKLQRLFTGKNKQNSWKYYFSQTLQYCPLLV